MFNTYLNHHGCQKYVIFLKLVAFLLGFFFFLVSPKILKLVLKHVHHVKK